MNRILLGTAQLSGFRYANLQAPLTRAESFAILDAAWEMGIRGFDTAESYGAAADRLEEWLKQKARENAFVTTKVTPGGGLFNRTLGAANRFYPHTTTVYLHGIPRDRDNWLSLQVATRKLCGVSIYTAFDHSRVCHFGRPHRWQLPISTFTYFQPEEPCDLRAVFRTGTNVFDPVNQIRWARFWLRPQDRLVIGVDSPQQLEAIARACEPSP